MSEPEHIEHSHLEPPYSCQYHLVKMEQVSQQLADLRDAVKELNSSIKGNGKEGIIVKVDRNTNFRMLMTKLLWLLFTPLYGGLIAFVFQHFMAHH
ncbi:MAG: hypothetical protein OEM52_10360 [bacterium]|nr:hypothetical protein [bacterium]